MEKSSEMVDNDENISQEEKEKIIKNMLDSISKGKNTEEDIEKLSKLLANMNEKERKELLKKLFKESKNAKLIQK
jgi:hypothetical protein